MNSPDNIPFLSFISLDRQSAIPIYLQLAQQLTNAIQRGYLIAGTKLPGTRKMAEICKLHRQTIVNTYDELDAQGWIETIPNKGTFVLNAQKITHNKNYPTPVSLATYPVQTGYQFQSSHILTSPFEYSTLAYQLDDGKPDIRLLPYEQLSKQYATSIRRKITRSHLSKHRHEGSLYFREQLSNYLNYIRGLHISKDNILTTKSSEMSLYILTKLLVKQGDTVLVAALGNFSANMIFQDAGADVQTVAIDEYGLSIESVKAKLKKHKIRMVYVTPNHHYPTTVSFSVERRIELLNLARAHDFVIIEDDYDFDFQYDNGMPMPMASADIHGMVIYTGTFGNSLTPNFKTGFIVAPVNLIFELQKHLALIDRHGDIFMEHVLGEMIEEGDIHRLLKKCIKTYQNRRDEVCEKLEKHFPNDNIISFRKPHAGLAIWLQFHQPISLLKLALTCKKEGLFIPQNMLYQNRDMTAIRLGFGNLNAAEMEHCLSILRKNIFLLID